MKHIIKVVSILVLIWLCVWAGSAWFGKKKATSDKIVALIDTTDFADWSKEEGSSEEAQRRREILENIGNSMNRLDLREREKLHESGRGMVMFRRLSGKERKYFVDLTLTESMKRMMEAFDQMDRRERQKMVERSLKTMRSGATGEDIMTLDEKDPELVNQIIEQGLKSYYQEASAETKMDLAPLMDAFNEVLQGFSGPGNTL